MRRFAADNKDLFQMAANTSAVIAAIAAGVALYNGALQFQANEAAVQANLAATHESLARQSEVLQLEKENRAYDLYLKYQEMLAQSYEQPGGRPRDDRHIAVVEAIYRLESDDAGWRKAVERMLSQDVEFLTQDKIACETYEAGFLALAKNIAGPDICR